MNEKEPIYITKLREHLDYKIENHAPKYFKEFRDHFDRKIEKEVGDLAAMTAQHFLRIEKEMAIKASKVDVDKILSHIGEYEVRTSRLEKEVFA